MKKALFYEITPESWDEAKSIFQKLRFCIFRGQADNSWPLKTSIERAAEQFRCPPVGIWEKEKQIIYNFKSRAHQHVQSPPDKRESLEWLALMQHYGCPTRLLDFTRSSYISSFFAMESADKDACVWAINDVQILILTQKAGNIGQDSSQAYPANLETIVKFSESFIDEPHQKRNLVVGVTPSRLNDRTAIQKGTFLMPCNLEEKFEKNLCETFNFPFDSLTSINAVQITASNITAEIGIASRVMKINLPRKIHCDSLIDLYKMNIDAASLFPGLEGLAKSLKIDLRVMEKHYWDKAKQLN